MGSAIGDILPLAVGVAVSPMPIVAIILMLFSKRAKSNGLTFVLGWMLGILLVGGIMLLIGDAADISSGGGPGMIGAILRVALGLLLIVLAVRNWRKRPAPGEEPRLPRWMAGIDAFTPIKAFGLGAALSGLNPKNLAFIVSASLAISQAGLTPGETIVVCVLFVIIASCTVAGPALFYVAGGERAAHALEGMRGWLAANNAAVMAVVCLLLGAVVLGKGIGGLFS